MAINGVTYGTSSVLNQSVLNLKSQMATLQSQLTSGEKSTTYAGMGVNEGFAIAARSQLSNISAFTDTMTNINTNIGVANTSLQALVNIGTTVQNGASSTDQTLNSNGQTMGQQTAAAQLGPRCSDPQYAVGRSLSVFRQRHQYAVGGFLRRHHERDHHAGRIEAGDRRAAAGRPGRQRPRAADDHLAVADAGSANRSPKTPPARRSA